MCYAKLQNKVESTYFYLQKPWEHRQFHTMYIDMDVLQVTFQKAKYSLQHVFLPLFNSFFFKVIYFERVSMSGRGQRKRERESQTGSTLSAEPKAGLHPTTLAP